MNELHIEKVKEEVLRIFDATDETILSVSYGFKSTGGILSEERCIKYGVVEKKPESEIAPDKLIPKTMIVDGVEYKTDVFEQKRMAKPAILIVSSSIQGEPQSNYGGGNFQIQNIFSSGCHSWKFVTDTPGARINNLSVKLCGERTASHQDLWDGNEICSDSGYTPPNGTGYHWEYVSFPGCSQLWVCNNSFFGISEGSNDLFPVRNHKMMQRPLMGGISMINRQKTGDYSAGTLGAIVIDSTDGKMVGLTNSHVSGTPSYLNNGDRLPYCLASDISGGFAIHYNGIQNMQPSYLDNQSQDQMVNYIGTTKRIFPLVTDDYNEIDCAIINLSNSIVDTNSWNQMTSKFTYAPIFATTAEIDSMTPSTPVFYSGRTSGPVGTYVTSSWNYYPPGYEMPNPIDPDFPYYPPYPKFEFGGTCNFKISSTSISVGVNYEPTIIYFTDCILTEGFYPCQVPAIQPGDSGSILYAYINGVWKIVGLQFAGDGGIGGGYGIVCRIDNVARLMKLQAYTGGTVDANPNTPSYLTLDMAQYATAVSASINGKTYWQVGKL